MPLSHLEHFLVQTADIQRTCDCVQQAGHPPPTGTAHELLEEPADQPCRGESGVAICCYVPSGELSPAGMKLAQ
jgi:hypothetical protein